MRPRILSPVRHSDFRLWLVGDACPTELSATAKAWLDASQTKLRIAEFSAAAGIDFAGELFSRLSFVGVLHCEITTSYESEKEWLLFANSVRVRPEEMLLSSVFSAKDGDFVFLPMSTLEELEKLAPLLAERPLTKIERFFVFFGKLRVSMPHLGGTYFERYPTPCPREMLASKESPRKWKAAEIFYVIDHCDYLILNKQGEVGFIPIEPNRSIEFYAPDFDAFLRKWLSDLETADIP